MPDIGDSHRTPISPQAHRRDREVASTAIVTTPIAPLKVGSGTLRSGPETAVLARGDGVNDRIGTVATRSAHEDERRKVICVRIEKAIQGGTTA